MRTASTQDTAARLVATSTTSPSVFAEKVTSLDLIKGAPSQQIRAAVLGALGYYVGARIGFALTLDPSSVPILWPPTPILLAGLLLTPVRSWAVVFAATFAAHLAAQLQGGVPLAMILSTFVSSSAGALVGAVVFRRLHTEAPRLDTLRETVILLLCAGLLAPFVSSFLDAALNGWGPANYWTYGRTRFFSNVLSELTIVPLIVTTAGSLSRARQAPRSKWLEAVAIFSLLLAASWFVFVRARSAPGSFPSLFYVPFPLLAAAAVRLGPWGASTSVMACALVAIWGAVQGHGPFVAGSAAENAQTIQLFLIIASVSIMSLAALTEDRASAESKARRSEEQLAIALDAAQIGRWDWDVAQQRLEWSDITRRMYGVPLDGPVSIETYAALIHPDDRHAIEAATQDGMAGRPIDVEFRIVLPDGTVKWILSRGKTLFDAEGRATRMVGIKVDITSRKQTELQLKEQGRELAHIDRLSMVGELSVAIAHELNQPLAAILANVGAARRFLSHSPPNIGQVREIVEAIGQDNRRAADVIRKVGALLRRDDLPRATLQLNDVVADVIDIARADIIGRGVSLSVHCDRGLAPIAGDRVQLQQVLLNLVLNACDAMDSVPETARRLTIVTSEGPEHRARVTVCDSGPGVAGHQLSQVFEPFVTSKPQGLGLGLAVCRSIVTAHEGTLWAENNPDGGASFCFELPCPSSAQEASGTTSKVSVTTTRRGG
jgi:two-component system, LuxR family, sensor kinase FixL